VYLHDVYKDQTKITAFPLTPGTDLPQGTGQAGGTAGVAGVAGLSGLRALCAGLVPGTGGRGGVTGEVSLNAQTQALVRGVRIDGVHEWFGWSDREVHADRAWTAPMTLLMRAAASLTVQACMNGDRHRAGSAVAIGRAVWPDGIGPSDAAAGCACGDRRLILVDADTPAHRLWAADLALRSGAFGVVLADGTGFDLASTRRLQLACESGRTACVLARPPWEERELSAAASRWRVRPAEVDSRREGTRRARGVIAPRVVQRWSVDLLRCKGLRPTDLPAWSWRVEEDHAAGACGLATDILDRRGDQGDGAGSVLGGAG